MANTNGVNAQRVADGKLIPGGEYNGHKKIMFDEITFSGAVQAIGDTFKIGAPLPKGSRVLGVKVKCPSLGTTGIFSVGYEANGVDVEDADGFLPVAQGDVGGQAVQSDGNGAGIMKKFEAATQVFGIFTEATDAADGDKLQAIIEYIAPE